MSPALAGASLKGVRIGVLRKSVGQDAKVQALFAHALADLKAAGAELVEIDYASDPIMSRDELHVLLYETRVDLGAYLAGLPGKVAVRSLTDVIAFTHALRTRNCAGLGRICSNRHKR